MSEVAAATTQTLTVSHDARGVAQVTGSHNIIYVIAADTRHDFLAPIPQPSPNRNAPLGVNPYRSLDAFDEASSELFFGREALTGKLLQRLEALLAKGDPAPPRLLTVMGPSGSGKSSVVRAGLIPAIAHSRFRKLQGAEVAIIQPGRRPVEALAAVLARVITRDLAPVAKTLEFEAAIRDRATGDTHDGLSRIARARGTLQAPLIVVVDQFEEVYTLVRPADEKDEVAVKAAKDERSAFVRTLLHAASEPDTGVFVVLTLRSDFYGAVSEHADVSGAISESHELVPAMAADELVDVIRKPAALRGLVLPDTVVDQLVRQALDNPSALPLVQHALFRFWNAMTGAINDPAKQAVAYDILSDLGGTMAATASQVMVALPSDADRALVWATFLRGVQLGEGVRDTKRRVQLAEILPRGTPVSDLRAALRDFVRERLLSMGGEVERPDEGWVEITHESLIANWSELRERLNMDRSAERFARRAQEAADLWRTGQGDVWQGIDLTRLKDYAGTHALTESQGVFLAASDRMARRRTWIGCAAVILLALLFLGSASAAWLISHQNGELVQANAAEVAQRKQAEEQREKAEAQTRLAQLQEARAVSALARQETERGDAMTGMLATLSVLPDTAKQDPRPRSAPAEMALLDAWLHNREVMAMIGHTDYVGSASFSPDGKRVVTASWDKTARVWELSGPTPVSTVLAGHTGPVQSASFSPDGKRVVTASDDKTARVWELSGPTPVSTVLAGHTDRVWSASFSPDGKRVVTASVDKTARVWELSGPTPVSTVLAGHTDRVSSASFSPDGKRVVTASVDKTARVWELSGPTPVSIVLAGHTDYVQSASFSPDGKRVVTASWDKTARVWELSGPTPVSTVLAGHTDYVGSASFSPDGKRVVTASVDKTARVWELSGPTPVSIVLAGHTDYVQSASFSPDGKRVVTASDDKTARVWELSGPTPVSTVLAGHTDRVWSASFSPDGKRVVTASVDKTARVWELSGPTPVSTVLAGHTDRVWSASFSPDGKRVVTASEDNTARVWELSGPTPVSTVLAGHTSQVSSASFSPDGKRMVTASVDKTARVWELSGPTPVSTVLAGHTNAVWSASFSPDGKRVVTASDDKTARVWELSGPTPVSIVSPATSTGSGVRRSVRMASGW